MNITAEQITENLAEYQLRELFNLYCSDINDTDSEVMDFDEETINEVFGSAWAGLKATLWGNVNMNAKYFQLHNGNINTLENLDTELPWSDVAKWLEDNERVAILFGIGD